MSFHHISPAIEIFPYFPTLLKSVIIKVISKRNTLQLLRYCQLRIFSILQILLYFQASETSLMFLCIAYDGISCRQSYNRKDDADGVILGLPLDNCALLRKPAMVFSLSDHKSMFCLTFKRRKNTGKTTYQLYLYSSSFIEYIIWAHIFITITYYSTRPLKGLLYCFSFSFHKNQI